MPLALPVGLFFALAFGLLVWFLSPVAAAAAMVGLAGMITVVRQPLLGLLLFGLLACFLPYSTVQVGIRTTVSEALLLLIWGAVLLQSMFASGYSQRQPLMRTERWLLALMLFSAFPFLVGQMSVAATGNGPVNWIRWLLNLSTLFLVARLLQGPEPRQRMVLAILGGTLALLLLSIPVYLKNRNATAVIDVLGGLGYGSLDLLSQGLAGFATRMGSPWMHPNVTGGALAMLLPLAYCYGVTRQGWGRWLGLAVAILGGAGLLLTGSRGALVALALVMLWLARKRIPNIGHMLAAGFVLGLILLVFYPPLQDRLLSLFSSSDASTDVRLDEYANFPRAMAMFPFGIGFKVDPPVPGTGLYGISNLWLNFIYKLGIPGMLLFIATTVSWWKESRLTANQVRLDADTAIWLGTRAGILAALLSGLFDHYFSFTNVLVAVFWLLLGLNLHEARRLRLTVPSDRPPSNASATRLPS